MADNEELIGNVEDPIDTDVAISIPAGERPVDREEVERKLRRDVARLREQVKSAQSERETALASLRTASTERLVRSELRVEAVRAGIVDLDALRLLDAAGLTVHEDGNIEGAAAAIAALKEAKPYLFGTAETANAINATTSAVARTPQPATPEKLDARTLGRDQWHAERDRLIRRIHG